MTDVHAQMEKLAIEPGDVDALEAIESAYSGAGRWEELLRVYEDNALRASGDLAVPILRKAADVCLDQLASGPRAEAYLKRALDVMPADVDALAGENTSRFDIGSFNQPGGFRSHLRRDCRSATEGRRGGR